MTESTSWHEWLDKTLGGTSELIVGPVDEMFVDGERHLGFYTLTCHDDAICLNRAVDSNEDDLVEFMASVVTYKVPLAAILVDDHQSAIDYALSMWKSALSEEAQAAIESQQARREGSLQ